MGLSKRLHRLHRLLTCWQPWWWSLHAHLSALGHQFRGHRVKWGRDCIEIYIGHLGCITCDECPDTSLGDDGKHVGLVFWARDWRMLWWLMGHVCAWRGHAEPHEWMKWVGPGDDDMQGTGEYCCSRCCADVPSRVNRVT